MIIFFIVCALIIVYYIYMLKKRGIFNSIKLINFILVEDGKEKNIKQISFISNVGLSKVNLTPLLTKLNNTHIICGSSSGSTYKERGSNVIYSFTKIEDAIQEILEKYFETKIRNVNFTV